METLGTFELLQLDHAFNFLASLINGNFILIQYVVWAGNLLTS